MMEDDYLDYFDEEHEDLVFEGSWISVYSLPPLAAVFISIVLGAFMINFAHQQISDLDSQKIVNITASSGHAPDISTHERTIENPEENNIASFFTPEVQYWSREIGEWSESWNIDANLIATVMQIESCGHPKIVSSAGATGLFQVMPYHFKAGESATHPPTNALRGINYLSRSLEAHNGDVYKALAGYNAGITGSQRAEHLWPSETKRYTYWGIGIYEAAVKEKDKSERLDEWLTYGGASLCDRAAEILELKNH